MGNEVDGGVLGSVLLLGYVGLIVWIVGVSFALARVGAGRAGAGPRCRGFQHLKVDRWCGLSVGDVG